MTSSNKNVFQWSVDQNDGLRMIYNNVYFGDILKYSCEANPIKDSNTKQVKYVKYVFTVDATFFGETTKSATYKAGDNFLIENPDSERIIESDIPAYAETRSDDIISVLRERLNESRKSLFIMNSGYGNIFIQGDVAQGNVVGESGGDYLSNRDILTHFNINYPVDNNFPENEDEVPVDDQEDKNIYRHRDVAFGPEPQILRWEPLPARKGGRVVFDITFYVKDCLMWKDPSASNQGNYPKYDSIGLLTNFSYSMDYTIDDMGFQSRTVSGQAEITNNTQIVQSRSNDQQSQEGGTTKLSRIAKSADDIRDSMMLLFRCPNNFKRVNQKYTISEDRSVLSFKIQDDEIKSEEAYPEGILDIDVNHSASSTGISESGKGGDMFLKWSNELTANITVADGYPYSHAWKIFSKIVLTRLSGAYGVVGGTIDTSTPLEAKDSVKDGQYVVTRRRIVALPARISISEKIYRKSQRYSFTFSWILHSDSITDTSKMIGRTGIFTSINDSTFLEPTKLTQEQRWKKWKQSFKDVGSEHPRGKSLLKEEYNDYVEPDQSGSSTKYSPMLNVYFPDKKNSEVNLATFASGTSKNIVLDTCLSSKLSIPQIAVQQNQAFKHVSTYQLIQASSAPVNIPMIDNTTSGSTGVKGDGVDLNQNINRAKSLVSFRCRAEITSNSNDVIYNKQRNSSDTQSTFNEHNGNSGNNNMPKYYAGESNEFRTKKSGQGVRSIQRSFPTIRCTVYWTAKRLGGPMPQPRITKVGGVEVELLDHTYMSEILRNDLRHPLYLSSGRQYLLLKGTPDGLAVEAEGLPTKPT